MENTTVRIKEITINNFKNVVNGVVLLDNNKKKYKSSVLGLYGQNGSGKTALIDALSLLKFILCGMQIPSKYADYINIDAEFSLIRFSLIVENNEQHSHYDVTYEFKLKKEFNNVDQNYDSGSLLDRKSKVVICDEILCCSYEDSNEKNILKPLIDTSKDAEYAFDPKTKYEMLIGKDKKIANEVRVYKAITNHMGRSFIFSRELFDVIKNNLSKDDKYYCLLETLIYYGNFGLFVFNTTNSGLISMNALPLSFRFDENNLGTIGNFMIKLDEPTLIPQEALIIVKKVINNMNIVLQQIIPGLTIDIENIGTDIFPDNKVGSKIYLVSIRNGKKIPLKYESEGIKKIISILQLIIVLYNNSSITVAIDEFDTGVFEYLLGEILKIISEKGKGQLIFTSHNLRPLETIDKGFIAFTTTNPFNRYIRFSNVKTNNNLRDFYYRDIILGEQDECVYEKTNNYEIALAFKEAGENIGA